MNIIILLPFIYMFILLLVLLPLLFVKKQSYKCTGKNIVLLIPTFNDEKNIVDVLKSILSQEHENHLSVLIINDGSTDSTAEVVANWIKDKKNYDLINIQKNTGTKGKALAYAKKHIPSTSHAVICIDGDTILDRRAIQNCLDALFASKKLAAVCGFLMPMKTQECSFTGEIQRAELYGVFHGLKRAQSIIGNVNTLAGALVAHKTEALKEVGWFEEWLVEDICWTWRAKSSGWDIGFAENAFAYTECPANMSALYKQRRRWYRGKLEALKTVYSKKNNITLWPWFIFSVSQILSPISLALGAIFYSWELMLLLSGNFLLHLVYALRALHDAQFNNKWFAIKSAFITAVILDVVLLTPHIRGFYDEISNSSKSWLTR